MRDSHGRNIDYIRISVTNQCNLRCIYCMPEKNGCTVKKRLLSREELVRLCRCFAELGISKIKLTGGEPLMRRDLALLIRDLKAVPGIGNITLTTNGVLLKQHLPALVEAGLDAVNISMDSLDEENYERICRRRELKSVLESVDAALACRGLLTKINCVPLKGMNDRELADMALLAKDRDVHVRFIEMMPIGYGKQFGCRTEDEVKEGLKRQLGITLRPYEGKIGNGPSHYYTAEGFQGKIGFISAVSHKFCGQCNRVRLTCEGFLKTCLQYNIGCDLRRLLDGGADDQKLREAICLAIGNKPVSHHFDELLETGGDETKGMSEIGG